MVIVEELGKLFAQTFVALPPMAERDRPLEQVLLHLLGQIAPRGDSRAPEKARKPFDLIACIHHGLPSFH
jgi:hypothetical protein